MKLADVEKIRAAGLISEEQQQKIVAHFGLDEEDNKVLIFFSALGGILVSLGVILVISSNWDDIPKWAKLITGLSLLIGAHFLGHKLNQRGYTKGAVGLHLLGSGMFLANIGLVGQIYHLSSHLPNAYLIWLLGIAPLPWILRSKAQYALLLLAFFIWIGLETNSPVSPLHLPESSSVAMYASLGLLLLAVGYRWVGTNNELFASASRKIGLILLHFCAFLFSCFGGHRWWSRNALDASSWMLPILAFAAITAMVCWFKPSSSNLSKQWRWVWVSALGVNAIPGSLSLLEVSQGFASTSYSEWFAVLALGVLCVFELQIGVFTRFKFLVNLSFATIILLTIRIFVGLLTTMGATGEFLIVGGIALVGMGLYLEKKRRALIKEIKTSTGAKL